MIVKNSIGIINCNLYTIFTIFKILEGVDRCSKMFENKEESEKSGCSLWMDVSYSSRLDSYTRFWQDGFLTDVTLFSGGSKGGAREKLAKY